MVLPRDLGVTTTAVDYLDFSCSGRERRWSDGGARGRVGDGHDQGRGQNQHPTEEGQDIFNRCHHDDQQNTQPGVEGGQPLPALMPHVLFNVGAASSAVTRPLLLEPNAVTPAEERRRRPHNRVQAAL